MRIDAKRDIVLAHSIESFARVKRLEPASHYLSDRPTKRVEIDESAAAEMRSESRARALAFLTPEEQERQLETWRMEGNE